MRNALSPRIIEFAGSNRQITAFADCAIFITRNRRKVMSDLMQTAQEIKEWWFMDYIPRWVAASSGKSGEGDGFITEYWNVPLYANALGTREWLNTADKVRKFLA